jgi:hypothetical protein
MKRLKLNKRGISNVIVVMLSLVLIVIIVANVVLWSYQMNQLDWEKNTESVKLMDVSQVANSSWFVNENEYVVSNGSQVNGTYQGTQTLADGVWETFQETQPTLNLNGTVTADTNTYPLDYIDGVEISTRFRTRYAGEEVYMRAFNWTSLIYSDNGFNVTTGYLPTSGDWDSYNVRITQAWRSYVRQDGTIRVKLQDEGSDPNQTIIDLDFLGIRLLLNGSKFTFRNDGALTTHIIAIWIDNIMHTRYSANVFTNSGEQIIQIRADIAFPADKFVAKAVTERGNIAVFASD